MHPTLDGDTRATATLSDNAFYDRPSDPMDISSPAEPRSDHPHPLATSNGHGAARLNGPRSSDTVVSPTSHLSKEQTKYCQSMIRSLKRHRDAGPFLEPVDPVKLNIPDYPSIVRHPMDLSTVEKKLTAGQYETVVDFIADMRLIFSNCVLYNGAKSVIAEMAKNLERVFTNQASKIPQWSAETAAAGAVAKKGPLKAQALDSDGDLGFGEVRPKREVHPPSRDLPSEHTTPALARRRSKLASDPQLKFCHQIIREMFKKTHYAYGYPFQTPVDWVALNIPDYPKVVKHPMDLGTVRKRLEAGDYNSAQEFEADVRLVFKNCYLFNPPDNPVHKMGRTYEAVFDAKWAHLPPPAPAKFSSPSPPPSAKRSSISPPPAPLAGETSVRSRFAGSDPMDVASPPIYADPPSDADEFEPEQHDDIAEFERHLAKMARQLEAMKQAKRRKKGDGESPSAGRRRAKSTGLSAADGSPPPAARVPGTAEDLAGPAREITFEEKQELSEGIGTLTPEQMNEVVLIIRSSMPEISDSNQDEIELDIDSLDLATLWRLYTFVRHHTHPPPPPAAAPAKKARRVSQSVNSYTAPNYHTPGQPPAGKRQRLQSAVLEMDQTRRISQLEEKLKQFDSVVRASPKSKCYPHLRRERQSSQSTIACATR
ncbi:hypothetical protein IWQ60_009516 [Tieghemiomyces parasiticus]|uniref:Bromodomain-containing protein n=1 Tax=Tieghemiomyces parasiticus TaxID=78921 RepID=A0A9W7ZTR9_9FUNG|nr:hypothetical protein IWQ60_009516 [Tieghemiomyces parasiticus]